MARDPRDHRPRQAPPVRHPGPRPPRPRKSGHPPPSRHPSHELSPHTPDVAPMLTKPQLARAVNEARLTKQLRLKDLAELLERESYHPGLRLLAPYVVQPTGPTRSEFEDRFVTFAREHGLPAPRVNTRVAGYEVDALFPDERVIVELDGWKVHSNRRSFERDRDKDAALLAAGYVTVRITWERLTH